MSNAIPTVLASTGTPAGYMLMGGLATAVFMFIVFFTLLWVIFFTFRPSFVRIVEPGETKPAPNAPADPARAFVAALVIALLIVVIVWMFGSCR